MSWYLLKKRWNVLGNAASALTLASRWRNAFQRLFGTGGIPLEGWLFILPFAPALLLADEARKAIVRRREKIRSTGGAP